MKNDGFYIKEIKWKNHPVLGDICLDFSTKDCRLIKQLLLLVKMVLERQQY